MPPRGESRRATEQTLRRRSDVQATRSDRASRLHAQAALRGRCARGGRSFRVRREGRFQFKLWDEPSAFERAYIGEFGQVAWSDEVEMCTDALYLLLTGKTPEEVFPNLAELAVDA